VPKLSNHQANTLTLWRIAMEQTGSEPIAFLYHTPGEPGIGMAPSAAIFHGITELHRIMSKTPYPPKVLDAIVTITAYWLKEAKP